MKIVKWNKRKRTSRMSLTFLTEDKPGRAKTRPNSQQKPKSLCMKDSHPYSLNAKKRKQTARYL
jgi:hypothetical protein